MISNTFHRRRGRPVGMTLRRIDKRYIIAAGVIAGLKIAHIARQIGVSRSWASREAHSLGVQDIIGEALLAHWDEVKAMFVEAMEVLRAGMHARTERRCGNLILHGGPDHKVRFAAVDVVIKLLKATRETGHSGSCLSKLLKSATPVASTAYVVPQRGVATVRAKCAPRSR